LTPRGISAIEDTREGEGKAKRAKILLVPLRWEDKEY
jgi:hypothetical protein